MKTCGQPLYTGYQKYLHSAVVRTESMTQYGQKQAYLRGHDWVGGGEAVISNTQQTVCSIMHTLFGREGGGEEEMEGVGGIGVGR